MTTPIPRIPPIPRPLAREPAPHPDSESPVPPARGSTEGLGALHRAIEASDDAQEAVRAEPSESRSRARPGARGTGRAIIRPMDAVFEKSLALHAAVAERLRAQPDMVERARRKLDEWIGRGGRSEALWIEWHRVLDGPLEDLLELLIARTEAAAQLRSASPFAGFIDPRERESILRAASRRRDEAA